MTRADRHNNPIAATTEVASQGLKKDEDYSIGESFLVGPKTYYTARFLKDPVETSIKLIDAIGFRTNAGSPRWTYINIPYFVWKILDVPTKRRVIEEMYTHEGGTTMKKLFVASPQ